MAGVKGMKHSFKASPEDRQKIDTRKICTALQNHVHGKIKMSSTQVRAAQILLNKTMPNLNAIDFQGNIDLNANVTRIEEVIIDLKK